MKCKKQQLGEKLEKEVRGPKRVIHIPKEILTELYEKEQLSILKVAERLQCSQDTVARRLREYGIPRRQVRLSLPQEKLAELYECDGYTIKELAARYGCSHTTIGNRLHDLGIRCERDTVRATPEEEETIVRAYRSGNSASFIAKNLGLSRWSVLQYLRKHKMAIRQSHRKKPLPMKEIKYLYDILGMTTIEIADLYDVKACTIAARLRDEGTCIRGNRLSIDVKKIVEHYLTEGRSIVRTAEAFGCSYTAVRKRLIAAGVYEEWYQRKK